MTTRVDAACQMIWDAAQRNSSPEAKDSGKFPRLEHVIAKRPAEPAVARGVCVSPRRALGRSIRRHDPKGAALFQPGCALVAQQRAADLAGIVARADVDDFETLRMLVSAELVGQKAAHAVD